MIFVDGVTFSANSSSTAPVETSTGLVTPASFDRSSRCPDEIVRRIRLSSSYEDSTWKGKLLETYDTQTDRFKIAPCFWTLRQYHVASTLQHYSDSEILSIYVLPRLLLRAQILWIV